ncbi:MAG TPA: DUF3052 domain-containing protein [Candidatus Angelobacter sp.]|nr:DUF3052 domain-containing protein [Candidatus Angelobacter sp.]
MAGYSGTPLVQKIGIKAGHRVILRNHPPSFMKDLGRLPENTKTSERLSGAANVIVYFTDKRSALEKDFAGLSSALVSDGMLWIGWPKKASGRPTDLNENIVREIGLKRGLVDVKVCAIDETWSGLKFVVRVKDRAISK